MSHIFGCATLPSRGRLAYAVQNSVNNCSRSADQTASRDGRITTYSWWV